MLILSTLNGHGSADHSFENYAELFDWITTTHTTSINWRFIIHPSTTVSTLPGKITLEIAQALQDSCHLIEIRSGDETTILYIPLTPNVDFDYFTKKWCLDYCAFHHLRVVEI